MLRASLDTLTLGDEVPIYEVWFYFLPYFLPMISLLPSSKQLLSIVVIIPFLKLDNMQCLRIIKRAVMAYHGAEHLLFIVIIPFLKKNGYMQGLRIIKRL